LAIAYIFIPQRRFGLHRLFGLAYLIMWPMALYYYFADYNWFVNSFLVWALPATGVIQSISATYYFWFLPRKQQDHGYFSDRKALSFNFVRENIFFASLLCFQWLYYSDNFYPIIKKIPVVEQLFVFLPYVWRASLFPKTSFREGMSAVNNEKNKSEANRQFYIIATTVTKAFYIWAKHFIGFFLNYLRFLDRIDQEQRYHVYLGLIFSCFATTIAMFLHTLKFRRLLSPRASFLIYAASYFATFYTFIKISEIFLTSLDLCLITIIGLIINFGSSRIQNIYAFSMMILFNFARNPDLLRHVPETSSITAYFDLIK